MALLFVSPLPRFVPAGVERQVGLLAPAAVVAPMTLGWLTFGWLVLHGLESD